MKTKKQNFMIVMLLAFSIFIVNAQTGARSNPTKDTTKKKVLVAYFSATGTTKKVAEHIADVTGGDLFEIVPVVPYTSEDLNYNNRSSRTIDEQNNSKARPAISGKVENMDEYSIVFIGSPIWFEKSPKIIFTFLESYDLSGKRVIPFCTSGSSGIGTIQKRLREIAPRAVWDNKAKRFDGNTTRDDINKWVKDLKQ